MLHHLIKNSTLLDLSHAVNAIMQQPPNLSSILGIIVYSLYNVTMFKHLFLLYYEISVLLLELSPVFDDRASNESLFLPPLQPVSPLW